MADESAEVLVALATEPALLEVPDEALQGAARVLVDSVGCAIGGLDQPEARALLALAESSGPATLLGAGGTTSLEHAALTNGVLIRCLDFNDDYFGGTGSLGPHPSDTIGALAAAVESRGGTGRDLLLSVVLAYEVMGRIVDQLHPGPHRAWDYTFVHAAGTALAAGRTLGLLRDQLRHALGIAVVAGVGLYQSRTGELSNWKAFAGPHASTTGLLAARLAEAGVTGPAEPFAGRAGLGSLIGQDVLVEPAVPVRYKVEEAYFKSLPVRYTNQLALEIAIRVRESVRVDDIMSVVVHGIGRDLVRREERPELWRPDSRETADHSLPYLVAAALVDGSVDATTFTQERYRDPVVLTVADRVELAEDPAYTAAFPVTQLARLEVTTRSGERLVVEQANPKGHPGNPLSDAELEAKLTDLVGDRLPAQRTRELLDRLWGMAEEPSVTDVWRLTSG